MSGDQQMSSDGRLFFPFSVSAVIPTERQSLFVRQWVINGA